jgi:hypothetical protein
MRESQDSGLEKRSIRSIYQPAKIPLTEGKQKRVTAEVEGGWQDMAGMYFR